MTANPLSGDSVTGDSARAFETARGAEWGLLLLLPDLDHFLYWYLQGGKHFLQVNDRTLGPYACISNPYPSADGSTLAFKYNLGGEGETFHVTGGEWFVRFINLSPESGDRVYGPFEQVQEIWPCLSDDGKAFAFRFLMDGRAFVQAGDWAYGSYDQVPSLRLSRDGRHFLCSYQRAGEWYVRDEERIDGEFDEVYFGSSPEGTSLDQACFAYRKGDHYYVRLGDKKYGPYPGLNPHSLAFGADGASFVFSYGLGGEVFFQTESRTYGGFQAAGPYCGFGGAGNALFFGYKEAESWYYQLGEAKFGPYDFLWGAPVFSQTGREWGFTYKIGDQFFVRASSRDYGPFDRVDGLCFSQAGERHSFAYHRGASMYVQVDGRAYGPYTFAAVDSISGNTFSPGGESFCFYYTEGGRHYVRHDGAVYGPFEYALNPRMSADGKTVAVIHNVGGKEGYEKITGGRWYVQLNELAYDCGDEASFRFGRDGRTACWAYLSDGTIYIRKLDLAQVNR